MKTVEIEITQEQLDFLNDQAVKTGKTVDQVIADAIREELDRIRTQRREELLTLCPNLFRNGVPLELSTHGWDKIIFDLSIKLEDMIKDQDAKPYAAQIKSKFGGMRFYLSSFVTDVMWKAIGQAETESLRTCEWCGKPGRQCGTSWTWTLCQECDILKHGQNTEDAPSPPTPAPTS